MFKRPGSFVFLLLYIVAVQTFFCIIVVAPRSPPPLPLLQSPLLLFAPRTPLEPLWKSVRL